MPRGQRPLSQLLPDRVTVDALADPVVRERVEVAWRDNPSLWTEITVAGGADDAVLGATIAALADGRSETDLRTVLRHPATVVASDGLALDPDGPTGHGVPHPRRSGPFHELWPNSVRIWRRSSTHARRNRRNRQDSPTAVSSPGTTHRSGGTGHGTPRRPRYLHPTAPFPGGVDLVLVAGTTVVTGEEHTGATPGTVVRRAER